MKPNVAAAKAKLSHLEIDENPVTIKNKSRDFFWYSPVLKARLDHLVADFVVAPKNEDEVVEVLKVCYEHDCPVTTRGAGTGNYGQAMPFAGGCILHMKNMARVKSIKPGRVIVEPGCVLKDLDAACKTDSGQEIRMMSSTCSKSRRPRLPPGWERAKSSSEKPRASSTATASASPMASAAVVLAVGARFRGQASVSTLTSSTTVA